MAIDRRYKINVKVLQICLQAKTIILIAGFRLAEYVLSVTANIITLCRIGPNDVFETRLSRSGLDIIRGAWTVDRKYFGPLSVQNSRQPAW